MYNHYNGGRTMGRGGSGGWGKGGGGVVGWVWGWGMWRKECGSSGAGHGRRWWCRCVGHAVPGVAVQNERTNGYNETSENVGSGVPTREKE